MKASIKFREDQKPPLVRAKIPLSILGCPFQSGLVAGESKELSLTLATLFDSGPSLKLAYRPNDPLNPFSFVFRTGVGRFGSPVSSPMSIGAEFNLIGTQSPKFFIHFKPMLGDFCVKKSHSSDFVKSIKPNDDVLVEENGLFSGKKIRDLAAETPAAGLIGGLLSGVEASARTVLPVVNRAVLSYRWGIRFPAAQSAAAAAAAVERNPTGGISFEQFPVLVMNKIGVEYVADDDTKDSGISGGSSPGTGGVAEACLGVKRQLELIRTENEMLRKAMDDLKSEFAAAGKRGLPASGGGVDRRSNGGDKKESECSGFGGKATDGGYNKELKMAV